MLQKDPSRRASLDEIEAHDWLHGLDNALLSPEAPPHWLSGALSPSSPRSGVPECGDLLAARPLPQQGFPGPWQPNLSFTLRPPPAEEPPAPKNLPALQQICEEEEEEEEAEEEEVLEQKEELGSSLEILEEEGDEDDSGCVISDQPLSHGDKPVRQTPEVPPSSLPGLAVPCCRSQPDSTSPQEDGKDGVTEPNNNTNKPPQPSILAPSAKLILNKKEAQRDDEKTDEARRDDLSTDRSNPHNAPGPRDDTAAAKAEQGKRHSIKLRERLFQFPLCEKALAFNIPTHNKPKILPLAQYNCCHVL